MPPSSLFLLLGLLAFLSHAPLSLSFNSEDLSNGKFKTKDGSTCFWYELRKGLQNVTFGMACQCRTEAGRGQGYTCHYFGNPDDCQAYRESGKRFYEDIVQHITETCHTGCDLQELVHPGCPGNILTRKEHTPVEQPCYPHKKERYEL